MLDKKEGVGMEKRKVEVVGYDGEWPQKYRAEKRELERVFGPVAVCFHHAGSTSVPGLAAKPVIDIFVEVCDLNRVDSLHPKMERLGYEPMGEAGIPNRRFFRKGGNQRTHHVHCFLTGGKEIQRHLAFRDYLRNHPHRAEEYGTLKTKLAKEFPSDIQAYMDGKAGLIAQIEREALLWEQTRPRWTKEQLLHQLQQIGVLPNDTLMVHSSMSALGKVEGGGETVLDVFMEYMVPGLLVFPTHTWDRVGVQTDVFDPETESACVGILPNLFLRRPGVIRSLHPTHSVAAVGKDAKDFVSGEEHFDTPCPRQGCHGKLLDRDAKVLFLGCSLRSNTLIHGVEEWNHIPERLQRTPKQLKIRMADGTLLPRTMYGHHNPTGDVSRNYGKLEEPLVACGAAVRGKIGDGKSVLCQVRPMVECTSRWLQQNPDLFLDGKPIEA